MSTELKYTLREAQIELCKSGQAFGSVWVTYYRDSATATTVFATELEALRDAHGDGKDIIELPFGVELGDAERAAREAKS